MLYRCLVLGENFSPKIEGDNRLHGFYLTRWAEAETEADAETIVLELLRREPALDVPIEQRDPRASVTFEEIEPADPEDVPEELPGFVWFPMDV